MLTKKSTSVPNNKRTTTRTHGIPPPSARFHRVQNTIGRFNTDVENFHGRMAMLGLVGCALDEYVYNTPIVQQFVAETGIPSVDVGAFVVVVTAIIILEALNPKTERRVERQLQVFSHPGFTLETEILHGRLAMLAFLFVVVSEQVYGHLAF